MTGSLADLLAPQLPYLRRFARALSGTQEQGDAYVLALLEALVDAPDLVNRALPPRVAAFAAFLKVWSAVPARLHVDAVEYHSDEIADRRIGSLARAPRQAFLLSTLEEFTIAEIALIMGRSEDDVRALIDEAAAEIAQQLKTRIMIIEDEPLIAMEIECLVGDLGHSVVGIASTRTSATTLAAREKPSMVLADIHLADGSSGVDAVRDILADLNVPVIFITAYPERLLTGERPEPAFLVTKPFKPETVKAVISQALFFDVKPKNSLRGHAA